MKSLAPLIFLIAPLSAHEVDTWEWTLESGQLWKSGSNADTDYELIPTQLTLPTPAALKWGNQ